MLLVLCIGLLEQAVGLIPVSGRTGVCFGPSRLVLRRDMILSASSSLSETAEIVYSQKKLARKKKPATNLGRSIKFWEYAAPVLLRYASLLLRDASVSETEWTAAHSYGAKQFRAAVDALGGFFVKVGQIVAVRRDLFPEEYSRALTGLTDYVDPLPFDEIRIVIENELGPNEDWDSIFSAFNTTPIGAASIAQVHSAVLREDGREVAVKVQRPGVEPILLNDVKLLKQLAYLVRDYTPVDYFIVFSELETQLADEFDFVKEAAAMDRIRSVLGGDESDLVVPSSVPRLSSRNVLTMDLLKGQPLSRLVALEESGRTASSKTKVGGILLLEALTRAFGICIFQTGLFQADPHPGNIFVLDDGRFALIDYGQVKQISGRSRTTLAKIMLSLADRSCNEYSPGTPQELENIEKLGIELGVQLDDSAPAYGPAAVAIWLFCDTNDQLPPGYVQNELSPNSPANALSSFPQDLVLIARASVLIKGIAARLGVRWSLAEKWKPVAEKALLSSSPVSIKNTPSSLRSVFLSLPSRVWRRSRRFVRLLSALTASLRSFFRNSSSSSTGDRGGGGGAIMR